LRRDGYCCLLGEANLNANWELAVLGSDWETRLSDLRGERPLLLDIGTDSLAARSRLLRSGATDFWVFIGGAQRSADAAAAAPSSCWRSSNHPPTGCSWPT